MLVAGAGTSACTVSAASLAACKETGQHKNPPSLQNDARSETLVGTWTRCLWTLKPQSTRRGERREGDTWISFQGRHFSRITCGETAALPVSAGSHRARARAPQARSDTQHAVLASGQPGLGASLQQWAGAWGGTLSCSLSAFPKTSKGRGIQDMAQQAFLGPSNCCWQHWDRRQRRGNERQKTGRKGGARTWQRHPHPLGGSMHTGNRGTLEFSAAILFSLFIARSEAKLEGGCVLGERNRLFSVSMRRDGWH